VPGTFKIQVLALKR